MWEFLYQITKNPIFGFICGLIGFFIGNRLALGRDKRKEFNKIIEPIRTILLTEKINLGYAPGIKDIDILKLREELAFWKRSRFDIAVKEYKRSKSNENMEKDDMGGFSFKNTEMLIHTINNLLTFTKRK